MASIFLQNMCKKTSSHSRPLVKSFTSLALYDISLMTPDRCVWKGAHNFSRLRHSRTKKKEEEEKKEGGSAVAEGKLENYLRTRQPSLYGMLVKNKVFNPG